ncbi:MAG: peptidoglycan editing factor PgeF [Oscillibacter sp.]|nr:peptidoglycan editing factor PgeF [Oscillibacter sp.]
MPFETHRQNGLIWLSAPVLSSVRHGFSTRLGGVSPAPWDSLNLRPGMGDGRDAMLENYRRFCAVLGVNMEQTVLSRQVHRADVRACGEADAGKGLFRERDYDSADALVTDVPGLTLFVFSADCGTVLLYDPDSGAVGAVHAGWRGCAGGIVEKTVREMVRLYGTRPERLRAALGPCIGQCCFESDEDVPAAMREALGREAEPYLEKRGPKWHVDLEGLNRRWLLRAGVLRENLESSGFCTACRQDLFWSHRKLGEARGVQAAAIAVPVRNG